MEKTQMNPAVIEAVKRQTVALIEAFPELADDADLRADMIEGETDFNRVASRLVRISIEAKAQSEAVKALKQDYAERQSRFERQADAARAALAGLMEVAHLNKVTLPVATVSLREPQPSVEVTDADALPQGFFEAVRKPLKAEIKSALMSGETIPGATLALGESTVTVRVK
jgi:hypothetical protein